MEKSDLLYVMLEILNTLTSMTKKKEISLSIYEAFLVKEKAFPEFLTLKCPYTEGNHLLSFFRIKI